MAKLICDGAPDEAVDVGGILPLLPRLSDGIIIFDRNLRVRTFNPAYARIFELELGEIRPGSTIESVLRVLAGRGMLEDPEGIEEEIARRLEAWRKRDNRHERRRLRNGRLLEITRGPTTDGGMIVVHAELTEAAEREHEIERQRDRMRSILENLSEGVALVDERCRLIAFNDRFLDLYRVPRDAVRWGVHYNEFARHFGDLDGLSDDRRKLEIERRHDFACNASRLRVIRNLFDGRALEVTKSMLSCGEAVLAVRDVTAELTRHRELDEARRRAEELNHLASAFVARLSHEMRTSLNGVLGITALLERTELTPDQRRYLDVIAKSGGILLRLIEDALDFSRIEAETFDVRNKPFSITDVMRECVDASIPAAEAKGIELRNLTGKPHMPLVIGDAVRVKQIVLNLLSNAIKFTDQGQVTLALDAKLGETRAELAFYVADTGVGVPPEERDSIFSAFHQARGDDDARRGGVGLGLAITYRLVKAMGGLIHVEDEVPQGVRFTVTLTLPLALDLEASKRAV